jgi:hypothetical protein
VDGRLGDSRAAGDLRKSEVVAMGPEGLQDQLNFAEEALGARLRRFSGFIRFRPRRLALAVVRLRRIRAGGGRGVTPTSVLRRGRRGSSRSQRWPSPFLRPASSVLAVGCDPLPPL